MKNYTKTKIGNEARVELHDKLALTGAEVSINQLPAGAGVPFKENSLGGFTAEDTIVY